MAENKGTVAEFLGRLKGRPVVPLPGEPEELAELLARIDTPGRAAEITGQAYDGLLARERVCVRLPLHFFTLGGDGGTVRLFWLRNDGRASFGCKLAPGEATEFAELFRVAELLRKERRPVNVVGYGPFELRDFLPGERFYTDAGEVGQVCKVGRTPGTIDVWLAPDTLDPRRSPFPPGLRVFATTPAQGVRVARRVAERGRRKRKRA